ncbi:unnamed protein product [Schistocephalus solidus]|uniref:Variant-specific surface protein n=1 Tax=Schistocephalus solidus TaxID=70667 RepID=A0A183SV89_SCHSO|nr:unnamed protein product [Schistocephalus solidus]VDL94522.1 unnamed protein product [Schistocephalus solidus]
MMKFATFIALLLAAIGLTSASQKITVISGLKRFMASIPDTCMKYMQLIIKWKIIVTSKKDIDWIFIWANSTTCQKCLDSPISTSDIGPCMKCLYPYDKHINKLPNCKDCLHGTPDEGCARCLVEVVYVTEAVICAVEAKVKMIMTLLQIGV